MWKQLSRLNLLLWLVISSMTGYKCLVRALKQGSVPRHDQRVFAPTNIFEKNVLDFDSKRHPLALETPAKAPMSKKQAFEVLSRSRELNDNVDQAIFMLLTCHSGVNLLDGINFPTDTQLSRIMKDRELLYSCNVDGNELSSRIGTISLIIAYGFGRHDMQLWLFII